MVMKNNKGEEEEEEEGPPSIIDSACCLKKKKNHRLHQQPPYSLATRPSMMIIMLTLLSILLLAAPTIASSSSSLLFHHHDHHDHNSDSFLNNKNSAAEDDDDDDRIGGGIFRMRRQAVAVATAADYVNETSTSYDYYYAADGHNNGHLAMCGFVGQCWQKCDDDSSRPQLAKGNQGPQGPQGPQGLPGFDGVPGDKGEKGVKGFDGVTGPTGEKGLRGDKGERGDKGHRGARGEDAIGEQGDKGETGETGQVGEAGVQGCKGQKGQIGQTGQKGEQGPQGDTGPVGDKGIEGPKGVVGPVGPPGPQPGQQGPTGDKGVEGIKGIAGSPGGAGEKGENGRSGRPGSKISVNIANIKSYEMVRGPKGDKGDNGECIDLDKITECRAPGLKGERGDVGDEGPIGPIGLAGGRGEPGPDKECPATDPDEESSFIKGDQGRPGSRPPQVLGEKGEQGDDKQCNCDAVKCPANFTIPCTPNEFQVTCAYQIKKILSRPGPRGPKGDEGERGPKGDIVGPGGYQGEAGPPGQCQRCKQESEPDEIVTSPNIYVLHEQQQQQQSDDVAASTDDEAAAAAINCPSPDHTMLWRGYSFVGSIVNNIDAFHDLGGPGSCLPFSKLPDKTVVSFTNIVDIPGFQQMKAQVDLMASQQAYWLGKLQQQQQDDDSSSSSSNNRMTSSRCVVCQSLGPVRVFHGTNQCPDAGYRQTHNVQLWQGRSLAMIEGGGGQDDAFGHGVRLDSTASCLPRIELVRRSCTPGRTCQVESQQQSVNSYWMPRADGKAEPSSVNDCVVCALEPKPGVSYTKKPEGQVFVQHSQVGSMASPGCKAGHTQLFNGFSLLAADSELNGVHVSGQSGSCSSSFAPLVTAALCEKSQYSDQRRFCKPKIQHSLWMLSSDYVPTIIDRAISSYYHASSSSGWNSARQGQRSQPSSRRQSVTPGHLEVLLSRKHNSTDLETFQRNYVSRCSMCMSRGPIYVRHGLEASAAGGRGESMLTCLPGYSKLWHGYSFVMATSATNRIVARDLSSPESCLRSFEPIIALDCPSGGNNFAANTTSNGNGNGNGGRPATSVGNFCRFPFSAVRAPSSSSTSSGASSNSPITSHWLASAGEQGSDAGGSSSSSLGGEQAFFSEVHAKLVSRCVVCELIV